MAKETYPEARLRLFREFSEAGLTVKPTLKIPQVKLTTGHTLYFKAWAVYLEAHSLWIDIRGMSANDVITAALNGTLRREETDAEDAYGPI